MDECIECGAVTFDGGIYCENCDFFEAEEIRECTACGSEFDHAQEGEYDTCGACLREFQDAA